MGLQATSQSVGVRGSLVRGLVVPSRRKAVRPASNHYPYIAHAQFTPSQSSQVHRRLAGFTIPIRRTFG